MLKRQSSCVLTIALMSLGLVTLIAQPASGGRFGRGGRPLPPVGSTPTRHFEKIADGVYYATSTGSMSVGANAVVIVNDQDVFLLDPGESPASARALVNEIKTITDKPIDFVADSHFISITPMATRYSDRR
jgi:hypothetical protein